MVKKLAGLLGSEGVVYALYSIWGPAKSRVPWESALGPVPYNVFNNDLEKVVACLLIRLADDTKLGGQSIDWREGWPFKGIKNGPAETL